MDDVVLVGRAERVRELDPEVHHLVLGQRILPYLRVERRPRHQLHDEVVGALVLPDVVDGADAGMIELRAGEGLLAEPAAGGRVGQRAGVEQLDGDVALEAGIVGPVDHTHPACPDLFDKLIGPEPFLPSDPGQGL